jgi:hypothetical protein
MQRVRMFCVKIVRHCSCTTSRYVLVTITLSFLFSIEYAMQMEIPAMSGDDNELELSYSVASADDMGYDHGNDPDDQNGIRVDNAILG